ncbi:MAG: hypothetical protein ACAI44_35040 [Candidatus Sericytochromatia bacterium]
MDPFGKGAGHKTIDANSTQAGDYQFEVTVNGSKTFVTKDGFDALNGAINRTGGPAGPDQSQRVAGSGTAGTNLSNANATVTNDPTGMSWESFKDSMTDHAEEQATSGSLTTVPTDAQRLPQ